MTTNTNHPDEVVVTSDWWNRMCSDNDILVWYDEPLLFYAHTEDGSHYLMVAVEPSNLPEGFDRPDIPPRLRSVYLAVWIDPKFADYELMKHENAHNLFADSPAKYIVVTNGQDCEPRENGKPLARFTLRKAPADFNFEDEWYPGDPGDTITFAGFTD